MARSVPIPVWAVALAFVVVVGGVVFWMGRSPRGPTGPAPFPPPHSAVVQTVEVSADDFIGSQDCAYCQVAETAASRTASSLPDAGVK